LVKGKEPIIVIDNTNIRWWEFRDYVWVGALCGYKIKIHTILPETMTDLQLCAKRTQHRVPAGVIARQALEFQPYPDWRHEKPEGLGLELEFENHAPLLPEEVDG
jgi:hypothetical protein